ncbi:acyltransferase family protein [Enterobacter ludwigii]|uniref:acyltransferase family protein n=1 Tax=Enterobacter ludwigii TaxID=299767 RepID=UPI002A81F03B|nr:acyltransferase [Enterobacter ludwigii]
MEFRKDINALRAIAVIAVVLFHFDNNLVPGGFAGVDVFFVISGYLMTKIICDRLNNESFSIYGFYKARARRIVPALAITCLMTLVLGWLFIAPGQYLEMGKDSLSSMLFISNFLYYLRSGYFDDSSTNNFLLHTWSLSVEWQFYVIYPLVLLFVKKLLGLRFLPHAITFMALTSFASGLYGTYIYSDLAYFMFPSRAWAMLAGGVLYYIPAKAISPKIFFIGIIALGYSFFAFSKFTPWPGVGAVIPVLGAVLYIASKKDNIVLNNKITQFIGTISYEVYLTHWPVLVLIRKLNSDMSLISYTAIIIIIS